MIFKGFIFDFDGLILDTEIPRFTAWQEAFSKYGFPLTYRDWWKTIGTGPTAYDPGKHLYDLTQEKVDIPSLRLSVNTRTDELLQEAELLPGVKDFIKTAHHLRMPMAVASSSDRSWVISNLEKFNILEFFEVVFTSEDVEKVKPDPELYLRALQHLSLPANSAVAFEDSPNGIKSAKQAGLRCVAVPNRITREMDLSAADLIISSFEEISPTTSFFED